MTSKLLDRRTVLRGAGVALALPLLEAMMGPRSSVFRGTAHAGGGTAPPKRLLTFFVPCGAVMDRWTPTSTGTTYDLTTTLRPLAPVRDAVSVLTGLDNTAARRSAANAGPHSTGAASLGSALPMTRLGATGPTLDRVAAARWGGTTRFRALAINNEPQYQETDGEGVSTAVFHDLSWDAAGQFVPSVTDPSALFDRLFRTASSGESARRRSLLDAVRGDAQDLRRRLGSADVARVDAYLDGVRDLEREVTAASTACATPDAGAALGGDPAAMATPDRARLFLRILTAALRCDLTRFASFALANAGNRSPLPWIGITEGHHAISHRTDAASLDDLERITTYEITQFAYLLSLLAAAPEGDGTLLDHTAVLLFSEVADGARHTYESLPVLLAGRGGGRLVSGRHLRFAAGTPIARLYATLLGVLGDPAPRFGLDGDTTLGELLV